MRPSLLRRSQVWRARFPSFEAQLRRWRHPKSLTSGDRYAERIAMRPNVACRGSRRFSQSPRPAAIASSGSSGKFDKPSIAAISLNKKSRIRTIERVSFLRIPLPHARILVPSTMISRSLRRPLADPPHCEPAALSHQHLLNFRRSDPPKPRRHKNPARHSVRFGVAGILVRMLEFCRRSRLGKKYPGAPGRYA